MSIVFPLNYCLSKLTYFYIIIIESFNLYNNYITCLFFKGAFYERYKYKKKIKEPKYVTIYNILFKMITLGEFSKNDRLPSEPDLARDLGVSRTTLRQALTLLQEDGLIKIIRGKGNFITKDSHYINTIPNNKIQSSVYNF